MLLTIPVLSATVLTTHSSGTLVIITLPPFLFIGVFTLVLKTTTRFIYFVLYSPVVYTLPGLLSADDILEQVLRLLSPSYVIFLIVFIWLLRPPKK